MWAKLDYFVRLFGAVGVVVLFSAEHRLWQTTPEDAHVPTVDETAPRSETDGAPSEPASESHAPQLLAACVPEGLIPRRGSLVDDLSDHALERRDQAGSEHSTAAPSASTLPPADWRLLQTRAAADRFVLVESETNARRRTPALGTTIRPLAPPRL
jgi:hypothetical protein